MKEWRSDSDELKRSMAAFVHELAPWEWFLTMTFRYEAGMYSATKSFNRFMRENLWGVSYFFAIEQNPSRDGHHVHALAADCGGRRRKDSWAVWFAKYGRNRIEPVRTMQDVEDYVAKYVTKETAWWDFKLYSHRGGGRDSNELNLQA